MDGDFSAGTFDAAGVLASSVISFVFDSPKSSVVVGCCRTSEFLGLAGGILEGYS